MITITCTALKFLSTLSLRRATAKSTPEEAKRWNFYPRSPCGERRYIRSVRKGTTCNFYPRSPCGERHTNQTNKKPAKEISIHALLAESDLIFAARQPAVGIFLSTLSLRRATRPRAATYRVQLDFYPRSPCGERHPFLCTSK